jgi:DNA-binding NtrC family response regulator
LFLTQKTTTNRRRGAAPAPGRFRRDLYYRIAVLRLTIPPLRSRDDDVVLLAHHFARLAAARLERPLPQFDDQVLRIFRLYSWPGNVRELRNVVENMILLGNPDRLEIDDVPMEVREQVSRPIVAPLFRAEGTDICLRTRIFVQPASGDSQLPGARCTTAGNEWA